MKCPNCGHINPEAALRCVCGYDFGTKQARESYVTGTRSMDAGKHSGLRGEGNESSSLPRRSSRTILPQVAGVLYLLFAVYDFSAGVLQLVLGLSSGTGPAIVGLPNGADTISVGEGNLIGSIIPLIIARSLFRRSRRAWKWGLFLTALGIPGVLLAGGLNCLTVPVALAYGMAAVVL